MQINIAESSGFCFGVTRALNICNQLLDEDGNVYILGDIVHNQRVVRDLEKKGIKKIEKLKSIPSAKLVIRAHGAARETFEKASRCGFEIIDATCPKVKEIYDIARRMEPARKIIIIGDKAHDEVKGIAGQLENAPLIIENAENAPIKELKKIKKAGIVTQSTQSQKNIRKVLKKIGEIINDVKFVDTTCRITRIKQAEIRRLPEENDTIFILGSRGSANTKRLYEISKEKNERTFWLENSGDLEKSMLEGSEKIGIMAGASTPEEVTGEVVTRIKQLETRKK